MGSKVNKVSGNDENTTVATEDKVKGRMDFPIADALYVDDKGATVTALNGDKLLIAVPKPIKDGDTVVYAGFNPQKHNPLKKTDFASMTNFMRYQAHVSRIRAQRLVKSAEEKEAKADNIEKFGDEATRKKVAKVARMRAALLTLEKGLTDDGVDVTEIK